MSSSPDIARKYYLAVFRLSDKVVICTFDCRMTQIFNFNSILFNLPGVELKAFCQSALHYDKIEHATSFTYRGV